MCAIKLEEFRVADDPGSTSAPPRLHPGANQKSARCRIVQCEFHPLRRIYIPRTETTCGSQTSSRVFLTVKRGCAFRMCEKHTSTKDALGPTWWEARRGEKPRKHALWGEQNMYTLNKVRIRLLHGMNQAWHRWNVCRGNIVLRNV